MRLLKFFSILLVFGFSFGNQPVQAKYAQCEPHSEVAAASAYSWTYSQLNSPISVSKVDIQQDSMGHLHLAFGGDHLYYAFKIDQTWQIETVDDGRGAGTWLSLVLDAQQQPMILYAGEMGRQIFLARRNGNQWVKEAVSPLQNFNEFRSLRLAKDVQGGLHASWFSFTDGIVYAVRGASQWTMEVVDPLIRPEWYSVPWQIDLALTPAGKAMLTYGWNGNTYLVSQQDTGWTSQMLDSTRGAMQISIAVDSIGNAYVVYQSDGIYYRSRPTDS